MSTASPGRSRVNQSVPRPIDPEVDRDDARSPASAVLSENGRRRTSPEKSPGPDVDELAGARAARERRRVVRLEPLARQDLAALDELRRGEPHASRGRARPRRRRPSSSLVGVVRRPRPSASASSAVGRLAVLVGAVAAASELRARPPGRPRRARRPGRRRRRSGRRTRRARRRRSSVRHSLVGVLGDDLGPELAGRRERQPLVVVVDDDQVADAARSAGRRRPRTARAGAPRCAGCAPGTRARGRTAGARPTRRRPRSATAGWPAAHESAAAAYGSSPSETLSSGEIPATSSRSPSAVGSAGSPAASRAASANAA